MNKNAFDMHAGGDVCWGKLVKKSKMSRFAWSQNLIHKR